MARGWESKSVESQQEEAARPAAATSNRELTAEGQQRLTQRRTLELARARALADLAAATRPAHRAMLERAIAALDERLAADARAAN
jgi:hypothetical protein